jgi:hypothetical protein
MKKPRWTAGLSDLGGTHALTYHWLASVDVRWLTGAALKETAVFVFALQSPSGAVRKAGCSRLSKGSSGLIIALQLPPSGHRRAKLPT